MRYLEIITQFTDTATCLSATVFKDTQNKLTVAFRGSAFPFDSLDDWLPANLNVGSRGAGFDQIMAMYNWWQLVSGTPGQNVSSVQEFIFDLDSIPTSAVHVFGELVPLGPVFYLIPDSAVATGVAGQNGPVSILSLDYDAKVNVTGHSLGGHLALAFNLLFASAVDKGFTFNAPGIDNDDNTLTEIFFAALGGPARDKCHPHRGQAHSHNW